MVCSFIQSYSRLEDFLEKERRAEFTYKYLYDVGQKWASPLWKTSSRHWSRLYFYCVFASFIEVWKHLHTLIVNACMIIAKFSFCIWCKNLHINKNIFAFLFINISLMHIQYISLSVAQIAHSSYSASQAKQERTKCASWKQCKSLWIKASAKSVKVCSGLMVKC